MLSRRSVSWTNFPTCSIWGEAAKERRRDSDPHPPHPWHDRDVQMTTTLSRSTCLCQTNGHDRWQDPPRGPSSSHSVVHGSNDPTTIWVATESQSREGDDDRHYMEPAQAGPSPGGQGTAITPHHPGLQPQPGGQAQTATGPIRPYSGFDEASGDTTATRDLKWQRDVNGDTQKIKQFQEVVAGLQDFRTYLLMKPGSAFCDSTTFANDVCRD